VLNGNDAAARFVTDDAAAMLRERGVKAIEYADGVPG